jgi:hypothetical protein
LGGEEGRDEGEREEGKEWEGFGRKGSWGDVCAARLQCFLLTDYSSGAGV